MSIFRLKSSSTFLVSIALKSSSVDVQLVRVYASGHREALLSQRRIVLLQNSQDPQLYTQECIKELGTLLKTFAPDIHRLTKGSVAETHVILYAPWFTSRITNIVHENRVAVTEKFISEQLKSIRPQKDLVTLEKKVTNILSEGQPISEIRKVKLQNLLLEVYTSHISKDIHQLVGDTVKASLPFAGQPIFSTSPILYFRQIRRLLEHEENLVYVLVSGEITEICVIEQGGLTFHATFPIGKHDFLREIHKTIRTYDYDLLYQKEVQVKRTATRDHFENIKQRWSDSLTETLKAYGNGTPEKILIISDSKTCGFFADLLDQKIKNDKTGVIDRHRIINFDISLLKDIILYKTPTGMSELDLQLEALI